MTTITLLKLAGVLASLFGTLLLTVTLYGRASMWLQVHWLRHTSHLDTLLRPREGSLNGAQLAAGQLTVMFIGLLLCVALGTPFWTPLLAVVLPIVLPLVVLDRQKRTRSHEIDQAMPDFMLAFANALRVTPSIGRAVEQVSELQTGPIAEELKTAVQEMRVGTGVEQALYNMAARMNSVYADSAFTGILIGRQVGGNIPQILESTAATIRELERLHGVLRTKTAEAKGQLYVMAAAPPVVGIAYEFLNPGHFDPFFASRGGMILLVTGCALWLGGVLIARQMLKVDF